MFVRKTAGGKTVAVGSGVPRDWTPEPKAPKKAAAKKVAPAPEPAKAAEPKLTFKSALDKES
jgi:hypothetical protein